MGALQPESAREAWDNIAAGYALPRRRRLWNSKCRIPGCCVLGWQTQG
jgi:hypothetical protein